MCVMHVNNELNVETRSHCSNTLWGCVCESVVGGARKSSVFRRDVESDAGVKWTID
jgi:hypothetical protein